MLAQCCMHTRFSQNFLPGQRHHLGGTDILLQLLSDLTSSSNELKHVTVQEAKTLKRQP